MMTKILGAGNYDLVEGTAKTNYTIPERVRLNEKENLNHAEARTTEKKKAIGGTVEGSKEACSHLSFKSCAEKMANEKVYQITPTVPTEREGSIKEIIWKDYGDVK